MAHEFLNGLQRHATHYQVTCEGMTQMVPCEPVCKTGSAASSGNHFFDLAVAECRPIGFAENVGAFEVPFSLKLRCSALRERNLAALSTLWRAFLFLPERAPHDDSSGVEVDVFPFKGQQLTKAKAGLQCNRQHRQPAILGCL